MYTVNISSLVLVCVMGIAHSRLIIEQSGKDIECTVRQDEPIGEVMERICDMCHEFSSHSRPNMRISLLLNRNFSRMFETLLSTTSFSPPP
ncbi:unnamed protein product [Caenorhabditis bovis]|uniref:Uncharacterized protein n=1 Tax=Caenorhabditis bovis TaxID=2654633 RepID=A0A8S1F4Y7_9PELO|nr:unnamed protein product [Caenorhabditis bovis]